MKTYFWKKEFTTFDDKTYPEELTVNGERLTLVVDEELPACLRAVLTILYDYFKGEVNGERKARAFLNDVGHFILKYNIVLFIMTDTDISNSICEAMLRAYNGDTSLEYCGGLRKDQLRELIRKESL
jgi:hypothetical protein